MITDFIDDHLQKEWFKHSLEAHNRGMDNVFLLGIRSLHKDFNDFYDDGLHQTAPYHVDYQPNPYRFQYDLFVHLWLNYYKILKKEIKLLRKDGKDDLADQLQETNKLYDISRSDCFFAASELRWPTTIKKDGGRFGKLIRDPWAERRVKALSDEHVKYVAGFGGGGQGKTTVFCAFSLMMFDHFIFTDKGSRCMISTTNEDKLKSVAWPYVTGIHRATEKGISLYAGRGRVAGKETIMRPENKDTAGVFKGILLGQSIKETAIIDKLTGTHGHPFVAYTLDEATTTPQAPLDAAQNFTMHAGDSRVMMAGNYDKDGDTLGANTTPESGWNTVDDKTGEWKTFTKTNQEIIVLHFNNDLSPGMSQEGHTYFPHLPHREILDKKYPPKSRTMHNLGYRRFWRGFRSVDIDLDVVINSNLVAESRADQELILIQAQSFFSFDSAPAENDRNMLTMCQHGLCPLTKQRIFGPKKLIPLRKTGDSLSYYRKSTLEMIEHIQKWKVKSGDGIVDFTGRPGHAERLREAGFIVQRLIYNQGVPDGRIPDTMDGRVYPALKLNIDVDFRQDIPSSRACAHHVAERRIHFAAWLCRTYIQAGRLRGLNSKLFEGIEARSMDLELFSRKCEKKNSIKYGERFWLSDKAEFKKEHGFSPDILDTIFQACYFAFVYLNIPLTPIDHPGIVEQADLNKDVDVTNEVWNLSQTVDIESNERKRFIEDEDDVFLSNPYQSSESDDYWRRI